MRGGFENDGAVGLFAGGKLLALELGEMLFHGVVEAEFALVHEHHHGDGGDGFGLRGDPEERVGFHHALVRAVGETDGLDGENFVLVRHERDGSGEFVFVHERLQRRSDGRGGVCGGRGLEQRELQCGKQQRDGGEGTRIFHV